MIAFIVLQPSYASRIQADPKAEADLKADILQFVKKHKSHYKQLAGGITWVDSVPKNPSGKLLRRVLRLQHQASLPAAKAKL